MSIPEHWEYYNGVYYDPITGTYIVENADLEEESNDWWNETSFQHSTWWDINLDEGSGDRWWDMTSDLEEGEWLQGESKTLPIEWYNIIDWVPISDEKEIVNATVEPMTKAHQDGGHFDAFALKRNLESLKLYGAERVDICLEGTSNALEIPLFGAVEDSMIKAVYIVPEGNASGDDIDYMKLIVRNKLTGGDVCTKTYIEGNDITAWKLDMMGPISKTHGLIPYGESTSLIVEKHGTGFTFPRSVVIILWDYATDSDFEGAGY
jgi:hypothetical protein